MLKHQRCAPIIREWFNWGSRVFAESRGQFTQMYHMPYTSYCKLFTLLSPAFEVDSNQGNRRSQGQGLIMLHCLIRYMAGGSFHGTRTSTGIVKATFHGVLHGCVRALDGWLCCIKVPTAKDTANIAAYLSGHYQHHGVN